MLLLGATRETSDGPVADLARREGMLRIDLEGLVQEEVARLMELTTGRAPERRLVESIHRQTDGNPFFVGEVVRLLASEDALERERLEIPQTVRDVLRRRLSALPPHTGDALATAAVIGREYDVAVLADVLERPARDVLELLEPAVAARLVTSRHRFAHGLVCDVLHDELPAHTRAELHVRVAGAIERLHASDLEPWVTELAHHHFEAGPLGDREKVIDYSVRGAQVATAKLAFEAAAAQLERALSLLTGDPARELELRLALGDAHERAGSRDAAREVLRGAADVARSLDDAAGLARAALGYGGGFAWYGFSYKTDPALAELLEEALEAVGDQLPSLRVRLLARLALERFYATRYDESRALSREAVALSEKVDDPEARLPARFAALFALNRPDDVETMLAMADGMVHEAVAQGDREMAFPARVFRLRARLQLGDLAGVEVDVAECERLAAELRQPLYRWHTGVLRAMLAIMRGSLEDGEREAQAAFALGVEAGQPDEAMYLFAPQAVGLAWARGTLGDLEAPLRARMETSPDAWPTLEGQLCWVLAEAGQVALARAQLERCAARGFDAVPRESVWLFVMAMLGDATVLLNEPAHAERLLAMLRPYEHIALVSGAGASYGGALAGYLGRLATCVGRWDEAESWFEAALAHERRMGTLPFVARVEHSYAEMLLRRAAPGDRERALHLASAALATVRAIGMTGHTERVVAVKLAAQGVSREHVTSSIQAVSDAARRDHEPLARLAAADGSVTVAFSDIEGSTALLERLGDVRWLDVIERHDAAVRAVAGDYGGAVVKSRGDGFMLAFADPAAAVRCALAMQSLVARTGDVSLRVRIGLHRGSAMVAGGDLYGRDVNLAARIADAAHGGEVLISAAVRDALADDAGVRLARPRRLRLKGLTGEHVVHPVTAAGHIA